MTESPSMAEIAHLVKSYDGELRQALKGTRAGLFRRSNGELYVRANVPLGQKYREEVVALFADEADLEFFYKVYLSDES